MSSKYFPAIPVGSHKVIHSAGGHGDGCLPLVFFFHWRNCRLQGNLSMWCHTDLGEEQCGQCAPASLTFLMQSVLVSVVWLERGMLLQLHPCILRYSQLCLVHEYLLVVKRTKSGPTYVNILVMSFSILSILIIA